MVEEANDLAKKQDLEEALEKAEKAKEIYTALLGAETVELADCWNVIGIGHYFQRNDQAAITVWDTMLNIRLAVLGALLALPFKEPPPLTTAKIGNE
ncbi:MAG: tetratricopeptide repeat protein [Lewinellaceae bacterium]|nr:tetratricopeptide repeat protein [Lewinellaceae bacterium]